MKKKSSIRALALPQYLCRENPQFQSQVYFMTITTCLTSQFAQSKDEYKRRIIRDRISALPLEIVVSIASLLPLKEAAATSVLSRAWQHVWKYTTTLNFQDIDFYVGGIMKLFKSQEQNLRDQRSRTYVNWVDGVLKQHRGQNVAQFKAFFFLNNSSTSSIDKWIEFAMEKRVEVLELHLITQISYNTEDDYTFPDKLLGLQNIPSLHSCLGFKSLKVLFLQHVGVTGEVLDYFLSNCPVLERLSLISAKSLVNLRIVGSSMKLKYLVIRGCSDLKSIEICEANIVSFTYRGRWINLLLRNVPLLVEVDMASWEDRRNKIMKLAFTQLSCCLHQINILKLDICQVEKIQNFVSPIFVNVKRLELFLKPEHDVALEHLSSFMKACPYMQRLVLKMLFPLFRCSDICSSEKVAEFPHHYLKVVELVGYRDDEELVLPYVLYLIKNAVALEKIIVDPGQRWKYYPEVDRKNALEAWFEADARVHAMNYLKEKVPSSIEFVCL